MIYNILSLYLFLGIINLIFFGVYSLILFYDINIDAADKVQWMRQVMLLPIYPVLWVLVVIRIYHWHRSNVQEANLDAIEELEGKLKRLECSIIKDKFLRERAVQSRNKFEDLVKNYNV